MIVKRYNFQVSIPCDASGKPLDNGLAGMVSGMENLLSAFQKKSVKINEGLANEEDNTIATVHTCYHGELNNNTPCVEVDI